MKKNHEMKKSIMVLLCVLFFSTRIASDVKAEETITWLKPNFPPIFITEGSQKGTGYFDRLEELIIANLPDYNYQVIIANAKRIMKELKEQKKAGCAALIKTPEREKFIDFSSPALMVLPNGVIILKSQEAKFKPFLNESGEIDLDRLLGTSELTLGISTGRRYSGSIDEILKKHSERKNIYTRFGNDLTEGLISMMIANRIDFILGYPTEVFYFMDMMKIKKDIKYIPVIGMEKFSFGHIGFPKNQWGKEIISKINVILEKHRSTPAFLSFYEKWLNKDTIVYYRKVAMEFCNK